ncbi:succinylglutamate desuccinylase/aspartoacylase family protein [Caenimonas aquaedulcis]|uniref:Succinylglutamate desuccinylase/aspartoacylase family protein n=1 Tax=Caenimonas aquaedulcis TaxID=2793270 RepID=A0A931H0Y1_9BURK|nr:succinylglutamate desuccinylase/aspartoacylase family protein [Caenimonas aquaedulcis]MBG9386513.1 succinylglutamate desuccinylase/aspartoacylase family protein [Caenimonas aquaedulcis]
MPHSKRSITLPCMTPGTSRSVTYFRFGKVGARPKAYLQAAIHANELPGAMALHHLMPMLVEADRKGLIQGEIVVVPTVNPIGLAQLAGNNHLGRYDFLGRENFNRNWLDLSDAVAVQVGAKLGRDAQDNVAMIRKAALATLADMKPQNELQALRVEIMKLSIDADIVLDLHCDLDAVLHLFLSKRDYPGPAETLAADLGAEATLYNDPYPQTSTFSGVNGALWAKLADRFPSAAIPQACLSATVELRSQHDVSHAIGESDARNLYRHLVRRGIIAGRAGKLPALKAPVTPIPGMDVGYCTSTGILVYLVEKGAHVRKGTAVCEVIDPADARGPKARKRYLAKTDGVFFSGKQNGALAWPGAVLFRIAGAKVLPHRKGMSGLDD